MSAFKKSTTNDLVPRPTNIKEYKTLVKGMLAGSVISDEWVRNIEKQVLDTSTDPQEQQFIKEAAKIEDMEKRVGKVGKNIVNRGTATEQQNAVVDAREKLIGQVAEYYGLDTNAAYDKYSQLVDRKAAGTKATPANQLAQMEAFIVNHEPITDPAVKTKLEKILD